MKTRAFLYLALVASSTWAIETPVSMPGEQLQPGELKVLGDTFQFTEGPAADAQGNVYFTDIRANRIHVFPIAGKMSVFRENTGGANGLYFDPAGNLLACEGDNGRVTSIAPNGAVTVLADKYNGKSFNKPNDLWIDPKGGVYFSDPMYGKTEKKQDGEHVYYLLPDRSKIIRVIDDFVRPNGLIGTPDGKTLYVADNGGGKIWKYAVAADGTLTDKTFFAEASSDGMTLDARGNLYATQDSVLVFNPAGKLIGEIKTPARPTNVTFGGKNNRTLFITARTHLCAVEMNVEGMGGCFNKNGKQ
jgi:gluconolactonase